MAQRALQLVRWRPDRALIARIALANDHSCMGRYQAADELFIQISSDVQNSGGQNLLISIFARLEGSLHHMRKGNLTDASVWYNQARELYEYMPEPHRSYSCLSACLDMVCHYMGQENKKAWKARSLPRAEASMNRTVDFEM